MTSQDWKQSNKRIIEDQKIFFEFDISQISIAVFM